MRISEFNNKNTDALWSRFNQLLWHDKQLGIWLDISRMKIEENHITSLTPLYKKAFQAMAQLEEGAVANPDEKRQVGHYWLRDPSTAPSSEIGDSISSEVNRIEKFASEVLSGSIGNRAGNRFTDILWIGIGGSGLGPLFIDQALRDSTQGLKIHFIDNIDPQGISRVFNNLRGKESTTLTIIVSKSGSTPEPRVAMDHAREFIELGQGQWESQSIAITMKDSKLYNLAIKEAWLNTFDLPDWVGGRTSITGAVGLLPIALLGLNIREFLRGARTMDNLTRTSNLYENPAALLSAAWYVAGEGRGKRDMVLLPYRDSLQVFSRYLQQLVMESLGKKRDRANNIVNQGLAVYGNKGSTDQHAYVQQLRDGVDNFFATFIEVLDDGPNNYKVSEASPGAFLSGFLQGTRAALTEGGRQSLTITLERCDEYSLGALISLFERAVGLYGEIVNINAYNQPGVEAGKIAASKVLTLQEEIEKVLDSGEEYTISKINSLVANSSQDSIYFVLRHLLFNNNNYSYKGEWQDPDSLIFCLSK